MSSSHPVPQWPLVDVAFNCVAPRTIYLFLLEIEQETKTGELEGQWKKGAGSGGG